MPCSPETKTRETLVLTRRDVSALLTLDECISAVENAFRLHAEGKTLPPGVLGVHAKDGGFHIKAAGLLGERSYFAVKSNGNFMHNRARHNLPTIQGVVILCDAERGTPLAVMDSMEITTLRTGAATAVAAKHLARTDAKRVGICGCGNQGRVQLRALARVRRVEEVRAFDVDELQAQHFAEEMSRELGIAIHAVRDPAAAARQCDIVVTCTPAKKFFLCPADISPGTFIAAVGADSEDKQELDTALLASSKVVADILEQCATIGELHHALRAGLMTRTDVYAELADVVSGRKPGRTTNEEITIFDSTGTALQDVAAAALVYERALRAGAGIRVSFSD